jgi:hypothetical protein
MVARVEEKASATAEANDPKTAEAGMETLPSVTSSRRAVIPLEKDETIESFWADDER